MSQRGSPNTKLMRETIMFAPRSVHVIGTNQSTVISAHTSILPNDNNGERRETPWQRCLYPFSPNHGNSKASKQMRITIDTMADSSSCHVHILLRRRRRESMMRCSISLDIANLIVCACHAKEFSKFVGDHQNLFGYLANIRFRKRKIEPTWENKTDSFPSFPILSMATIGTDMDRNYHHGAIVSLLSYFAAAKTTTGDRWRHVPCKDIFQFDSMYVTRRKNCRPRGKLQAANWPPCRYLTYENKISSLLGIHESWSELVTNRHAPRIKLRNAIENSDLANSQD